MNDDPRLFELADLILAVGRLIYASKQYPAEAWTPLESAVMRVIDRNPGLTAGEAAEATRLISSNFSRALRNLEGKGLVRREPEGRRVRLYPTEAAHENLNRLKELWSGMLGGVIEDPAEIDAAIATLKRLESGLGPSPTFAKRS